MAGRSSYGGLARLDPATGRHAGPASSGARVRVAHRSRGRRQLAGDYERVDPAAPARAHASHRPHDAWASRTASPGCLLAGDMSGAPLFGSLHDAFLEFGELGLFAAHFGLRRPGLRSRCSPNFRTSPVGSAKDRGLWSDPPSGRGHGRVGHSRAAARPACDRSGARRTRCLGRTAVRGAGPDLFVMATSRQHLDRPRGRPATRLDGSRRPPPDATGLQARTCATGLRSPPPARRRRGR